MANPYSQYTGARVQPLPPGYLEAYGRVGEMYSEGIAGLGEGIGEWIAKAHEAEAEKTKEALEKYEEDKKERATLQGKGEAYYEAHLRNPELFPLNDKNKNKLKDMPAMTLNSLRQLVGGNDARAALRKELVVADKIWADKAKDEEARNAFIVGLDIVPEKKIMGHYLPDEDVVMDPSLPAPPGSRPYKPYTTYPAVVLGDMKPSTAEAINLAPDIDAQLQILEQLEPAATPGVPSSIQIAQYIENLGRELNPQEQKLFGVGPSAFAEKMEWIRTNLPKDATMDMIALAQGGLGAVVTKKSLFKFAMANRGDLSEEDVRRVVIFGEGITDTTSFNLYKTQRAAAVTPEDKASIDQKYGVKTVADLAEQKTNMDWRTELLKDFKKKAAEPSFRELIEQGRATHEIPGVGTFLCTSASSGYLLEPEGGEKALTANELATLSGRYQSLLKDHASLVRGGVPQKGQFDVPGVDLFYDPAHLSQTDKTMLTNLGLALLAIEHRMGKEKLGVYYNYNKATWKPNDPVDPSKGGKWEMPASLPLPELKYTPPKPTSMLMPMPSMRDPNQLLPAPMGGMPGDMVA